MSAGAPTPGPPDPNSQARAQPQVIAPAQAALEALAHTREITLQTQGAIGRLLEIARLQQTPPELRTIVINPGNNGSYVTLDQGRFEAKSIGVINPTAVPVFLGIGGVSASPTSRAPSCPGQAVIVLPVLVSNLELGCDPAVLLGATAVVYLFRYLTVQPLMIGDTV